MAKRRVELKLTQEDVASRVVFRPKTGDHEGEPIVLSRNAYCMYEIGQVLPKVENIEAIAEALNCSPAWIAFGIPDAPVIEEYVFDAKKGFVSSNKSASNGGWVLSVDWLSQQFGEAPENLGLFMLSDFAEGLEAGDIVIFDKDAEPTVAGDTFIFAHKAEVKVVYVTHPPGSENFRIFSPDRRTHEDIALKQIALLGRVIGKIGRLERS